ncbi:MAG: hypothetical protein HYU86_03330 [Chloroflexi bacterium]|nr:hypothetical protein [Chloroflexota bacterium]
MGHGASLAKLGRSVAFTQGTTASPFLPLPQSSAFKDGSTFAVETDMIPITRLGRADYFVREMAEQIAWVSQRQMQGVEGASAWEQCRLEKQLAR